jgi:DNA-binding NtrC family response regulator
MDGRILVIDGSARMRDLFVGILELDQLSVRVAVDFDQAKKDVSDTLPDVVLVDATLAKSEADESSGGSASELARFSDTIGTTWPGCEVVFLIDAAHSDLKRRLERGRFRHFTRPFQIEVLRDLVTGLLDRRKVIGK